MDIAGNSVPAERQQQIAGASFLDNVLTALQALNGRGDRLLLDEALFRLGRVLRYVREEESRVTLGDECSFLEHYLELERLRFGMRFSYRVLVAEDLRAATVGRLQLASTILPLLERRLEKMTRPQCLVIECCRDVAWIRFAYKGRLRLVATIPLSSFLSRPPPYPFAP